MRIILVRWAAASVMALGAFGSSQAQTPTCRHIAAELQSLGRGSGQAMQQAAAMRQQYAEVARNIQAMGCTGGGIFGPQPPAECQGLRQRANALAQNVSQLEGSARQAGGDTRRRQLEDAYAANECSGAARIENVRAIYEAEANPRYATPTLPDQRPAQPDATLAPADTAAEKRTALPVCVRSCDGYFFPVNYSGAEGQYSDVCRASCPGAKAEMFWMPQGGDIAQAVSARGQSYSALPSAFKYRQTFDSACSCKAQGDSWGSALQQAEGLIKRKGDIIVTAETSERLANPDVQHKSLRGLKAQEEVETTASVPAFQSPLRLGEGAPAPAQPVPAQPLPAKRPATSTLR